MESFLTSASVAIVVASCLMYLFTSLYEHVVKVDIVEAVHSADDDDEPDHCWCRVDLNNGRIVYGWVRQVGLGDVGAIEVRRTPDGCDYLDWIPVSMVANISPTTEDNVLDDWDKRGARPGCVVEYEEASIAKSIRELDEAERLLTAKKQSSDECPPTKKPSGFPPAVSVEVNKLRDACEPF